MHVNYRRSSSVKLQLKYQTIKVKRCPNLQTLRGLKSNRGKGTSCCTFVIWRSFWMKMMQQLITPTSGHTNTWWHEQNNVSENISKTQRYTFCSLFQQFHQYEEEYPSKWDTNWICRTVWHHPITYARLETFLPEYLQSSFSTVKIGINNWLRKIF